MTVSRRHLVAGTVLAALSMGVQAQPTIKPMPMRKARKVRDGRWVIDLSLTRKDVASDGTVSVIAEARVGKETVGLAVDIGSDWKVVNPRCMC